MWCFKLTQKRLTCKRLCCTELTLTCNNIIWGNLCNYLYFFNANNFLMWITEILCNNFVLLVMNEECIRVSIQIYSRSDTTKLIPFHMINHRYAWKILTSAAFYSCQHNVVSKLNYYSYIHHLWTTQEQQQSSSESQSLSAAKWWIAATQKLIKRANGM